MRLSLLFLLAALQVSAATTAQNVSISGKQISVEKVFSEIRKQTGVNFFYTNDDLEQVGKIDVEIKNMPLREALVTCLQGLPLSFTITGNTIVIKRQEEKASFRDLPAPPVVIRGKVVDENGEPVVGASVVLPGTKTGTTTDKNGNFSLTVPEENADLVITSIGFQRQQIKAKSGSVIMVTLIGETDKLADIVISNGLFNRRKESFTGAAATYTGEALKTVSNQNVIKSLAILDPSFQIVENVQFGSDPNRLPDIQLRGQTGFPDLKGEYATNPNQPLFILDGFETTLEKVYDLNMNLVKSITLLKDASAKAIYGSKAGNGVVVIETIQPKVGKLRLSYSGSMDVTAPDLSSYHLTDAMQKIDAEVLSGKYSSELPSQQAALTREYTENLHAALQGVNTYWLSQPLQNGVGQRHNITMDGGENGFRYSASMNYNNVAGVMKGSDRTTLSGVINLQYRFKTFSFRNSLTVDRNKSVNSPYGNFSSYTRLNPYWRIRNNDGSLISSWNGISNPLYDATLNTKDFSNYTTIIENFYGEWEAARNLRFTARVGVNLQDNKSEYFIPANHSTYDQISPYSDQYLLRGEYSITNGRSNNVNSDLGVAYNLQRGKHQLFTNAIYTVNQSLSESEGLSMVGFPSDKMDNISLGYQYKAGTKATGSENTTRTLAVTTAANYSYDNRFLADFSYRNNASSQFGSDRRWGGFWSAGIGWNMHNEEFIRNLGFINQLRLRASTGTSGTQNFNSYQSLATYNYITSRVYNGDVGMQLLALPNPALRWQKVEDNNVGIDIALFRNFNIRFDYYIKDTRDLLSDQIIAPSAGFDTYKENIGEVRNQGFQLGTSARVYGKGQNFVNLFVNVAHNTNKIRKVSSSLKQLNENEDKDKNSLGSSVEKQNPSTRFEAGQSLTAIWVVPSMGIDPANGREIFIKKDGSLTYEWSTDDYVVGGDELPKYTGSFGVNTMFNGFSANFAFTFRLGGQMYNGTLVNRVENADFNFNVDERALTERWKQPGDISIYKNIADRSSTRPTSRFIQDNNELLFTSVSLGYELNRLRFIKAAKMNRVYFALNLNDLARISTIRAERGLDYPFARTISTSLQITF